MNERSNSVKVIVNKEELKNTGNNIIDYANDFKIQIETVKKLVESLNDTWYGTDMKTFVKEMNTRYIPKLEELKEELIKYGNYLKEVRKDYEELDSPIEGE